MTTCKNTPSEAKKQLPEHFEKFGLFDLFNNPPTIYRKRWLCRAEAEHERDIENAKYSHSRWPRFHLIGFDHDGEFWRL